MCALVRVIVVFERDVYTVFIEYRDPVSAYLISASSFDRSDWEVDGDVIDRQEGVSVGTLGNCIFESLRLSTRNIRCMVRIEDSIDTSSPTSSGQYA